MSTRSWCWLAVGLLCACQQVIDRDQERCADVTAQIEQALEDYTTAGLLLPGAEPCALEPGDFDARTPPEAEAYLLEAFASACQAQAETCSGVSTQHSPPPFAPGPAAPPAEPPPDYLPVAR